MGGCARLFHGPTPQVGLSRLPSGAHVTEDGLSVG